MHGTVPAGKTIDVYHSVSNGALTRWLKKPVYGRKR
jgi:hypothetical protein